MEFKPRLLTEDDIVRGTYGAGTTKHCAGGWIIAIITENHFTLPLFTEITNREKYDKLQSSFCRHANITDNRIVLFNDSSPPALVADCLNKAMIEVGILPQGV